MSFEEFERFQKAKTEALEKFYNDLRNAASRASSSSAPPPAASKPQEVPRPSRPAAASSSVPPPEPPRQPPPPEPAPAPVAKELPDYAELLRKKESKCRCDYLRYLIERQKKINEQYPPLPSEILPKDGEEECEDDEDDDEDLYDLVCLRAIVRKLNGLIYSNDAYVFWHTPAQRLNNFRWVLYYEAIREQAYQVIDELCNIPQYDDSDDNFDTDASDDTDSDQHSL